MSAYQRLLLVHSHVRTPDLSEITELFPYMNKHERKKYQNGFQSTASLKFPLNNSIPLQIAPTIYDKATPSAQVLPPMIQVSHTPFSLSSTDFSRTIYDQLNLVYKLLKQPSVVLNFSSITIDSESISPEKVSYICDMKEFGVDSNFDSLVLVVETVTDDVKQVIESSDLTITVISQDELDVDVHMKIYKDIVEVLKELQVETDFLQPIGERLYRTVEP